MFCSKCGKELPGTATFCSNCGARHSYSKEASHEYEEIHIVKKPKEQWWQTLFKPSTCGCSCLMAVIVLLLIAFTTLFALI